MNTNIVALSNIAVLYGLEAHFTVPAYEFEDYYYKCLEQATMDQPLPEAIQAARSRGYKHAHKSKTLHKRTVFQLLSRNGIKTDPMKIAITSTTLNNITKGLKAGSRTTTLFQLRMIRKFVATRGIADQFMVFFTKLFDIATDNSKQFRFQHNYGNEALLALRELLNAARDAYQAIPYEEFHQAQSKLVSLIVAGDLNDGTDLREHLIQESLRPLLWLDVLMEGFQVKHPVDEDDDSTAVCSSCPSTPSGSSTSSSEDQDDSWNPNVGVLRVSGVDDEHTCVLDMDAASHDAPESCTETKTTDISEPSCLNNTTTTAQLKSAANQAVPSSLPVPSETQPSSTHADRPEGSEKNDAKRKFTLDDFLIGRPLGRGRFGSVYLAKTKVGNHIVALKILYKEHLKKEQVVQQLKQEIEIHSRLKHENVLRLHSYFHDETRVFLVLEYVPGGELFTAMRNAPEGRFDERRAATVMKQLFSALKKCQKYQVAHRDIKPENILIDRNDRIKLADFGWAVNNTDSEGMKLQTLCGTVEYIPPEMVLEQPYDEGVDTWAAGVLMYEMLVGCSPFAVPGSDPILSPDEGDIMWRIVNCEVEMPSFLSPEAKELVSNLLVKDPELRLPIKCALQHPWIQKYAD